MTNKLLWSKKPSNTLIDDFIKKIFNYTSTNNYFKIHIILNNLTFTKNMKQPVTRD